MVLEKFLQSPNERLVLQTLKTLQVVTSDQEILLQFQQTQYTDKLTGLASQKFKKYDLEIKTAMCGLLVRLT